MQLLINHEPNIGCQTVIDKILEELKDEPEHGGNRLIKYRSALVEMKKKFFTQREMCEYLARYGIKVAQSTLSEHISRHPFTEAELNGITGSSNRKERKKIDLESWKKSAPDNKEDNNPKFNVDLDKPYERK